MKKLLFLLLITPLFVNAQTDTTGVFIKNGATLNEICPIKASGTKIKSAATFLSMGLAPVKSVILFDGKSSQNKISDKNYFMFYFSKSAYTTNIDLSGNNTPNDFVLMKFQIKREKRELPFGTFGVMTGSEYGTKGIDGAFVFRKIKDGVYMITLNKIEPGEYAFVFKGINGSGLFMPIYDFKIE